MRTARAHGVKVMLSGQGADEVLAGYTSYFDDYWVGLAVAGDRGWEDEVRAWSAVHGGDVEARLAHIRRRSGRVRLRLALPGYEAASRWWRRRRASRHPWYRDAVRRTLPPADGGHVQGLTSALAHSVTRDPLPLYLRLEDRNSMAHGLEARVPYLDHRVVECAFSLPERWLLRGPWNKYVLREAMRGRTPEVVHRRYDKIGFEHPRRSWFRHALAEPLADMLERPSAPELYDVARIRADLARHRRGEIDCADDLFKFAQLERWLTNVVPQHHRVVSRRELPVRLVSVVADRVAAASTTSSGSVASVATVAATGP